MFFALLLLLLATTSYAVPTHSNTPSFDTTELLTPDSDRTVGTGDPATTLRASFYYTCPFAGRKIRLFEWRGLYRRSDKKITVRAITNIDTIDPITVTGNSFWTTWDADLCTEEKGKVCSYIYFGRTEGTVEPDSVVMTLVTSSLTISERPKVSETCWEKSSLVPGSCPSMHGAVIKSCTIDSIVVAVVPPPKKG